MELSRTINSDKRYYLDENTIENAASFLQTMRVFNDAKIDLYNALYDQKYLASGPLIDHAYPVFLKEKYKTNDYYNAAIYTAASGSISSQKELKKYYGTTITADLKTRDEKIQMIQEALDKKKETRIEELTFSAAGSHSVTIEKIPAGSHVKVTEVYSGASYELASAKSQETDIIANPEKETEVEFRPAEVSFINKHDGRTNGGYGVKNNFKLDENGQYQYTKPAAKN